MDRKPKSETSFCNLCSPYNKLVESVCGLSKQYVSLYVAMCKSVFSQINAIYLRVLSHLIVIVAYLRASS